MANELNFAFDPGLTLEASIFANNWTQQGANIAMVETGAGTGLYVGSVPAAPAIADGEYQVLFTDTIGPPVDKVVGRGLLNWAALSEDRRAVHSVTAYADGVWVDTQGGGSPGTVIGVNGTQAKPCSVMADAIAIAAALGISNFKLHGPVTLPSAMPHNIFTAIAGGTTLDPAGFDIGGSILNRVGLTGNLGISGDIFGFQTSLIGAISGITGVLVDPGLSGTISVGAGTLTIASGASIVPGILTPIIDLNGVGSLNLRNYSGGIEIRGSTAAGQNSSVEVVQGQVLLDASNTAGTIAVRGWPGPFTDNSAGATINTQGLGANVLLATLTASGNTVDAELSSMLALRSFIEGGRDLDFAGNDALGWQRIERDIAGAILRRYNLFDEAGARINETVASFINRGGMISAEVAI